MRIHSWTAIAAMLVLIFLAFIACSPLSDGSPTTKISAEIILNQLRNDQPIVYDHFEIVGDLTINPYKDEARSKAKTRFVNSTIKITNSIFRGDVNFDQIIFKKPIVMEGSIFEGDAHFRDVSFLNLSMFNSTDFQKQADFEQTTFFRDAIFKNSTIKGEANFNGSVFMKEANFDQVKLNTVRFTDCQFNGYSRFGKAVLQESANFEGSRFNNYASFNQAQFTGKAFMGWAKFEGKRTYFTQSDFRDSVSFSGSSFKDTYFNEANFADEAAFLNSSFNGNVSFSGTRFQKDALFYLANFSSNVNLHECEYNRLVLHWHSIRNHITPDETIYKGLIKNYKNLIWISDVNECYFDFRHWRQSNKSWTDITKIPDVFLEWYCGYGTMPLNTLLWIGFFVLIFGLYYWSNGGILKIHKLDLGGERILFTAIRVSENTFNIKYIPEKTHKELSDFRSLLRSLKFSLFVLASKNTNDLIPNEGIKWQIPELERWLGRVLFVIFMYYVGSMVISYFTPLP